MPHLRCVDAKRFPVRGDRAADYHSNIARWIGVASLCVVGTSCTHLRAPQISFQPIAERTRVDLSVVVNRAATPGAVAIKGTASLPDKTQMSIVAVRYLQPGRPVSQKLSPKPTYAILDYQTVEIQKGQWEAALNLWQVGVDGRFQESWQQHIDPLKLSLKPDAEVVFLITSLPVNETDRLQELELELSKRGKMLDSSQVRVLPDGQRYIQASQTMAIALPSDSTQPPPSRPDDRNGGWGNRFIMPPEPVNPTQVELPKNRRTNAPAAPAEFLR